MGRVMLAAFLLVLPLLAQAVVPLDVHQLLHSVATVATRPTTLRRRLSATGSADFVTGSTLNNTECTVEGSTCSANGLVLLADAAPQPESEAGKLIAKISAQHYICSLHTTAAECTADAKNECQVYEAQYSADNSMSVEACGLNFGAIVKLIMDFGLCPKSLAYNLITCTGLLDSLATSELSEIAPSTSACSSGNNACKLVAGVCLPSDLEKKYDLTTTSGAEKLQSDVQNMSEKFWGCCAGGTVLATEVNCQSKKSSDECTGKCEWLGASDFLSSDPTMSSSLLGGTATGVCTMSSKALADFMIGANTAFSTYYQAADAKCSALSTQLCSKQPTVAASKTKADNYKNLQLTKGGGSGCGSRSATTASSSNMKQAGLWTGLAGLIFALVGFRVL